MTTSHDTIGAIVPFPDTPFQRRMAYGHEVRTGHKLEGYLRHSGGGIFERVRICCPVVATWADAFGNWHASVTEHNNAVNDAATCERLALAEIRAQLSYREGPNFAPEVVGVRLVSRSSCDGALTSYYEETNANEVTA